MKNLEEMKETARALGLDLKSKYYTVCDACLRVNGISDLCVKERRGKFICACETVLKHPDGADAQAWQEAHHFTVEIVGSDRKHISGQLAAAIQARRTAGRATVENPLIVFELNIHQKLDELLGDERLLGGVAEYLQREIVPSHELYHHKRLEAFINNLCSFNNSTEQCEHLHSEIHHFFCDDSTLSHAWAAAEFLNLWRTTPQLRHTSSNFEKELFDLLEKFCKMKGVDSTFVNWPQRESCRKNWAGLA